MDPEKDLSARPGSHGGRTVGPTDAAPDEERARQIAERVLSRRAAAPIPPELGLGIAEGPRVSATRGRGDGGELDREARAATRRTASLSTELEDVRDVEYRQLRLEQVVLVGLRLDGTMAQAKNSLRELAALATTAGSNVLDAVVQSRELPDAATYLGKGKARELADLVKSLHADTVIVDGEMSPSQRRGLEDVVGVKVVDRTALILDIFAQHAKSREGKAQVELAQLEYLLPRLRGWGESMSRQAGGRVAGGAGIGSRGPGETKIETDRRRIRTRMAKLRRAIAQMTPARYTQRATRRRGGVPSVAIAGYTNAGKSSLLNRITDADVLVEDALFATLDPTVRRTKTADGRVYTLTDTVGFVRNLPTQLVEAFRSTLEEVGESDLIVHVVDAGHPDPASQVESVRTVVAEIPGAGQIPELLVMNKVDLASAEQLAVLRARFPQALFVSAATGEGIGALQEAIALGLPRPAVLLDVLLPFDAGSLISQVHDEGEVELEDWRDDGVHLVARVNEVLGMRLQEVALATDGD